MLSDGPATNDIQALTDLTGFNGDHIARAHVGNLLISELEEACWAGRSPVITSVVKARG